MIQQKHIDVNCDLGEGFGRYSTAPEERIMPLISSVNIACGFHAGDHQVMARTVQLAIQHDVAIGAHPGYPDLQGFGRRDMDLSEEEIESMLLYQIGALEGLVRAYGGKLAHVKPHGALYNRASTDAKLALCVAEAVKKFSTRLILVGLAGSQLVKAGQEAGLRTAAEGFPERAYEPDGNLRSRQKSGALIHEPDTAAAQALRLATTGVTRLASGVRATSGVQTLCVHGDSPNAVAILEAIQKRLAENKITVRRL